MFKRGGGGIYHNLERQTKLCYIGKIRVTKLKDLLMICLLQQFAKQLKHPLNKYGCILFKKTHFEKNVDNGLIKKQIIQFWW